jgi:hypothetical protein
VVASEVNERIREAISRSDADPEVKEFLARMLGFELENLSKSTWRYMDLYEKEIARTVGQIEKQPEKAD